MALKLETQYPTRTTVDANNPNGTFKNSDPVGSLNGTPGDFAWAKDMWSFLEILMTLGSVTHSGAPDDANASQRYNALVKIGRNVWPIWDSAHTYPAGVIIVGSDENPYYSRLAANIDHDPISSPTWWRNFSFEALQSAARNFWPIWDSANIYPQGVGTVGSDGNPYHSLQSTNLNHDPTSSPTWWQTAFLSPATKISKGILFLGDQKIILSNGADVSSDIDFSIGRFTFDDGTGEQISNAYAKQLDASWVAGNNQGGLDTGSKAINTWYHCFAIYTPANGLSDYLFSTSATSPSMPSGYTKKRREGAVRTDGSNDIIPFFQYEKWFQYKDRILAIDLNPGAPDNVGTLLTVKSPLGVPSIAKMLIGYTTTAGRYLLITSPDETNIPATATEYSLYCEGGFRQVTEIDIKTNLLSQIRYRADASAAATRFIVHTLAYEDYTLED